MNIYHLIGTSALLITVGMPVMAAEINNTEHIVKLDGFREVPSILTTGHATLKISLASTNTILNYTLEFSDLSSAATMSHIHFGQKSVNGAVVAFLCGGPKPACPATTSGVVTGTIVAADIQAVPAQGIRAGNFSDFLAVLRSGSAYANLHSVNHPSGEVRGQIKKDSCISSLERTS